MEVPGEIELVLVEFCGHGGGSGGGCGVCK